MGERKQTEPTLDHVFLALSHPSRRRMLELLQTKPHCVTDLAGEFDLSLNVVSKHIKSLERAGLVRRTQEGRIHHLSADEASLRPAMSWLSHYLRFWQGTLDSLEAHIAKTYKPTQRP